MKLLTYIVTIFGNIKRRQKFIYEIFDAHISHAAHRILVK